VLNDTNSNDGNSSDGAWIDDGARASVSPPLNKGRVRVGSKPSIFAA